MVKKCFILLFWGISGILKFQSLLYIKSTNQQREKKAAMTYLKSFKKRLALILSFSTILPVYLLLFSLLLIPRPLTAGDDSLPLDSYLLEDWSAGSSLINQTIVNIKQTSEGYLWVLVYGQKLFRFDGSGFTWVADIAPPGLPDAGKRTSFIIETDSEGVLWFFMGNYLMSYRNGRIKIERHLQDFPGNDFQTGGHDSYGNLWLGTHDGPLYCLRGGKLLKYGPDQGIPARGITGIIEDSNRRLWVFSRKGDLYQLNEDIFKPVHFPGLPASASMTCLWEEGPGKFWIGTSNGLFYSDGRNLTVFNTENGLSGNSINKVIKDVKGNIWVATNKGLNHMRNNSQGRTLIEHRFENEIVNIVFEDRDKNIWFGTEGSGLKRLRPPVCQILNVRNDIQDFIAAIYYGGGDEVWAGTYYGDLVKINRPDRQIQVYYKFPSIITAICKDRDGYVWAGTVSDGLFRINPRINPEPGGNRKLAIRQYKDQLLHPKIHSLLPDRDNRLWIATRNGLNIYRKGKFKSYSHLPEPVNFFIYGLTRDHQGHVWISGHRGLFRFKNGVINAENLETIIERKSNSCFLIDPDGAAWVGGNGRGIIRYRDNELFHYLDNVRGVGTKIEINKILADDFGYLWISSPSKIARVNRLELNRFARGETGTVPTRIFGTWDGLKSNETFGVTPNTAIRTADGEMWFATKKGIAVFQPETLIVNRRSPLILIEKMTVNEKTISLDSSVLHLPKGGTEELHIYFTSPLYDLYGQVYFKYKLEGYDRKWTMVEPGEDRRAVYRKLSPGTYRFFVTGCNSDGIWSKKSTNITIIVPFEFLRSIYFKIFLLILLIGAVAVFLFYRQRVRLEKKYASSVMDKNKIDATLVRLRKLLEEEQVYQDDSIKLESLAGQLAVPPWYLSRIINQALEKSFFELVNDYRVEEVKSKLLKDNNSQSILDMALEAGFNTKSAFNRAFKKRTGLTPTQFKLKHKVPK